MWIHGSIVYGCSTMWCLLVTLGCLHTTMAQTTRYEWTFFKDKVRWDTANEACIAEDSRLIKVDNKLKRDMVEYFKDQWSGVLSEDYWIGVFDSIPPYQSFYWTDCTKVEDSSSHWAVYEPNNPHKEFCVRNTKNGGFWKTRECNKEHQFICEKELGECQWDDKENLDILASGSGYTSKEIQVLTLDDCLNKCKGDVNIPEEVCWAITYHSTDGASRCLLHKAPSPKPFLSQTATSTTTTSYIKNCFKATSNSLTITEVQDSDDLKPNGCVPVEPPALERTTEHISTTDADESTSTTVPPTNVTTEQPISSTLQDVDECVLQTNNCSVMAGCVNTPGTYNCTCLPGFYGDGITCNDVDECVVMTDNCSVNAGCVNTPGSHNCTCFLGFNGDGSTCYDVDECVLQTDNCSVMSGCVNTPGAYNCTCLPGFYGDGIRCTDVDECVLQTDNCSVNAGCLNTPGDYNCTCLPGFIGDGFTCTNVSSTNQTQYCRCPCPKNLTKEESKAFMDEILESLTINKTKASAYRRKYTSVHDGRVSAQSFGYAGTAILVIVFGGIFLSDLPRLLTKFRQLIHNLRNIGR